MNIFTEKQIETLRNNGFIVSEYLSDQWYSKDEKGGIKIEKLPSGFGVCPIFAGRDIDIVYFSHISKAISFAKEMSIWTDFLEKYETLKMKNYPEMANPSPKH